MEGCNREGFDEEGGLITERRIYKRPSKKGLSKEG